MIALALLGLILLSTTLWLGWQPYPFIGRAYRGGKNADMFWLAVFGEVALIVVGLVAHFSN